MTVGRNDKCPCGSGLKYKKCCGKDEAGHIKGLRPGIRMKGGVKFEPDLDGFVPVVHTWDNVECRGEPAEWVGSTVFATEEEALDYYKTTIRPSLQRLMKRIAEDLPDGDYDYRELE